MKKKFEKVIIAIMKIAFYIVSIIGIYFVILKLTDHSPSVDAVMIALMSIVIGAQAYLAYEFGLAKSERKSMQRQINAIGIDLKKIQEQMNTVNTKLTILLERN